MISEDMSPCMNPGAKREVTGNLWVVYGPNEEDWNGDHIALYWCNTDGWVDLESACRFTDTERKQLNLPLGGVWVREEAARDGAAFKKPMEIRVTCSMIFTAPEGASFRYNKSTGDPCGLVLADGRYVNFWPYVEVLSCVDGEVGDTEAEITNLDDLPKIGITGADFNPTLIEPWDDR